MPDKYTVLPRDDGADFQQSWMIHKNGRMQDNYTTKEAATNDARAMANQGDTLEIRRTDGTIQSKSTVRGSSGGDEPENGSLMPSSPNKYGEATRQIGVQDFFK